MVGSAVAAFAIGVCKLFFMGSGLGKNGIDILIQIFTDAYTISVIGQDEFEDVKVPNAPSQPVNK